MSLFGRGSDEEMRELQERLRFMPPEGRIEHFMLQLLRHQREDSMYLREIAINTARVAEMISCPNAQEIPVILRRIDTNTKPKPKPKPKKKTSKKRKTKR